MDVVSGVTAFSHILNIKEKLFRRNKEIASTVEDNPNTEKYCSLFLEHSYDPGDIGSNEKERIELVLAKKSEFTIPIRHLDWIFMESKLDSLKPVNFDIPQLLLVGDEGSILVLELNQILKNHIEYLNLKGKKIKKALESMAIQCTYADGYKQTVMAPKSLIASLCGLYSSR